MSRDPALWMWSEACALLERVDRLQRQTFRPSGVGHGRAGTRPAPAWEPPVDLFETASEFRIIVALPGVRPDQVKLVLDDGALLVIGERSLVGADGHARVHRLELPYGRFERRIDLPSHAGPLRLERHDLQDGCLQIHLRKSH